jgi:hypothetical protein
MDHTALRQLAAGAALDDLDAAERAELDRHLSSCAPCRRLSSDLDDVLGELALVAPVMSPPGHLRTSVLAALHESPAYAGPAQRALPAPVAIRAGRRREDRLGRWAPLGLAAVFAVVAVGLGARAWQLSGEMATTRTALADVQAQLEARQAAVALVADPTHVTVALHAEPIAPAANAVVMFRPGTTDAYLMVDALPATPAGQVYQLWFADAAGVHALGTYHHDGQGPFVAPFGVDLGDGAAAMVTLEPEGGVVGEPGPQVVFGEL